MSRPSLRTLLPVVLPVGRRALAIGFASALALVAAGCGSGVGEGGIKVAADDPLREGAEIFNFRCAGCHTMDPAGAEGSATQLSDREYKDGPNFNTRKEEYQDVLYAIRNGGFSSGPMPQNIVTGRQAELVACFVATYSGTDATRLPLPGKAGVEGGGEDDCRQQVAAR